jgi:hypothetical protein
MCLILPCLVLGLPIILSIFGEDNYEQFQYVSIVNNKKCFVDPKSKVVLKSVRVCSVWGWGGMEWNHSIPLARNRSIPVFGLDKKIVTGRFHPCVRFWNGMRME